MMDYSQYGLNLSPASGQNSSAPITSNPPTNQPQKPGLPTRQSIPRPLPQQRIGTRVPRRPIFPPSARPAFSPIAPPGGMFSRAPTSRSILATSSPPPASLPFSTSPKLSTTFIPTDNSFSPAPEFDNRFSRAEQRRDDLNRRKNLDDLILYKQNYTGPVSDYARFREALNELQKQEEDSRDQMERQLIKLDRRAAVLDQRERELYLWRSQLIAEHQRLKDKEQEVKTNSDRVTEQLQQIKDLWSELQDKYRELEREMQRRVSEPDYEEKGDPYWLDTFFESLNALEAKTAKLDGLLETFSKTIDKHSDVGTKDTAVLAMQVANPIVQMMREMDREGCEVTDEMIRQSSKEVRDLADTTEDGIQRVLGQLKELQDSFANKLDLLQDAREAKARAEAELNEVQKELSKVKADRDRLEQQLSYCQDCNHRDLHETSTGPSVIEFGQYHRRSNTMRYNGIRNPFGNWHPVDFVSLFSPKDVDSFRNFALIDTTRMKQFFDVVASRVILQKHRHFLAYNEVKIPCEVEGQGSLVVGRDPPSITNWGTWNCVNAMLQGSDDYCRCPEEAKYCLRYQVWSISPDPAGSTQNILKLMWFEIDPARTGWDVLQAMGQKYWIPVNFVTLFSSAEHAADNHPQWCDMAAVYDFFVTLMIGDSSGRREEYFRHADYFLEDAELDESDGVISNHCDFEQNGEKDLNLVDWHAELMEDKDMENWQCLNFVLALSEEEAEEHLRSVRDARPDQQDHDGWTMETCCCPAHTPFCLAIRSKARINASGESCKVIRIKWIQRSDPSFESGRMLASPVFGVIDPEVEEKLNMAFETCAAEEYDEDETDDDDQETDEDEEMGDQEGQNDTRSLFGGSDVDKARDVVEENMNAAVEADECQDGSPDTLDFERSAPTSPSCCNHARAYSPRQALPGLIDRQVAGQRRCRSYEDESEGKSKRRRVDNTTNSTDESEGPARAWERVAENQQFKGNDKW